MEELLKEYKDRIPVRILEELKHETNAYIQNFKNYTVNKRTKNHEELTKKTNHINKWIKKAENAELKQEIQTIQEKLKKHKY